MDKNEFMRDLWDVLRGNTEYITLEQFREKYDEFLVECDEGIRMADDHNEWLLSLQHVWSDNN